MKGAIYQINSTSQQWNNQKVVSITIMVEEQFIMMKSYFIIIKCTFKFLCSFLKSETMFQDKIFKEGNMCK